MKFTTDTTTEAEPFDMNGDLARLLATMHTGESESGWTIVDNSKRQRTNRFFQPFELVIRPDAGTQLHGAMYEKELSTGAHSWEGLAVVTFNPVVRDDGGEA